MTGNVVVVEELDAKHSVVGAHAQIGYRQATSELW